MDPKLLTDPVKLRNLLENAIKKGRDDIVLACQIRLAELAGQEFNDPLEKSFWMAVTAAEEFKTLENGRTTRLSRTRQKHARDGAKKCIRDLAVSSKFTEGFRVLTENGRPDLTFEAVLLDHAALFDEMDVVLVHKKLESYGLTPAELQTTLGQ